MRHKLGRNNKLIIGLAVLLTFTSGGVPLPTHAAAPPALVNQQLVRAAIQAVASLVGAPPATLLSMLTQGQRLEEIVVSRRVSLEVAENSMTRAILSSSGLGHAEAAQLAKALLAQPGRDLAALAQSRPTNQGAAPTGLGDCTGSATPFIPLPDLSGGMYQGYSGGLYPGHANLPPDVYLAEGVQRAHAIRPLGPNGSPDPDGKIGLLSIGMSNTTQEFSVFLSLLSSAPSLNPHLVVVDGAQGGQDALKVSDPNHTTFWPEVDRRLRVGGLSPEQVQVVWMKQAIAGESNRFPNDALRLQRAMGEIIDMLQGRFPNLQIVYMSSRTYAGYATTQLNPEPHAYHGGFAVKWLIEERINGARGGPWLAWGPYLWTNGTQGRSDGFIWECEDSTADGTHPSQSGRTKVAEQLLEFFQTDVTALPWFTARPAH